MRRRSNGSGVGERNSEIARSEFGPAKKMQGGAMATGTVKWFSDQKGYGFITPEDGTKDLFVHYSNITGDGFRTLEDGQKVEYEAGEGNKGPEATAVRPV
jgi:CspA family cold shock protein